jgi:hypothetical protein
MDWFVSEHVNGTTGLTPLQAWAADPTPLDEVPEEQLWLDFLVSKDQRKISKNGIRWEGIDWIGPELNDHVGERVEIRYLPHDRTFIEVFRNNEHLCTAEPNELLSDEASHAVLLRRREARAAARKRFTAANRLRKAQGEHSYEIDKKTGKRNVVVPAQQDLFEDGDDALAQVLGAGKVDSDQTRLF